MTVSVGTSGYAYDFWRGNFYPDGLETDRMLAFYSRMFSTVEINNTFYRIPKTDVVKRWAQAVPPGFRFVIKASRRITHLGRLKDTDESVAYMFSKLEALGDKLGPVLFQCPPNLEKDLSTLDGFLATLPKSARCVLEFRHDSWFCDEVYQRLRDAGVALCIADYESSKANAVEGGTSPFVATTDWGYLRLRDEDYDESSLSDWVARIQDAWDDAYVFFKHEETAPDLVERMNERLACVPAT